MNAKRFMVKGKRCDSENWVEGAYLYDSPNDRHVIIIDCWSYHEIDPTTIEPLAVPVIIEPLYGYEDAKPSGYDALCPCCEEILDCDNRYEYCCYCGQRLDWSKA